MLDARFLILDIGLRTIKYRVSSIKYRERSEHPASCAKRTDMRPVYVPASTAVPEVQTRTTLIDTAIADPTLASRRKLAAAASGPGSLTGPFNQNANKDDAANCYGGGASAVWFGLDLAAGTWPT